MNNKSTLPSCFPSKIAACLLLLLFVFCAKQGQGQVLAAWANSWSGISASPFNATTLGTNVNSAQLSRTNLTGVSSSARYNSSAWSASNFLTITITPTTGNVLNLNGKTVVFAMGSSGTGPNSYTLFSNVDNYASPLGTLATSCSSTSSTTITLPSTVFNGLSSITFKIIGVQTGCSGTFGSGGTGGPASITINGTATAVATPKITATGTLSAFTTTYGTPSASQSITVTGTSLTTTIAVGAVTGFEYSINNGTTWASTTSLPSTGGALLVRLAATANVSTSVYNSKNIVLSSTGATSVNIPTTSTGNIITAKSLTVTGLTANTKQYDGTTTATLSGTAALSGFVNGDNFPIGGTAIANFADANAGVAKVVAVSGYTVGSTNYSVTQPTGLTADITQLTQSITFGTLPQQTVGDPDFTLTATASSGLPVSYTSSDNSVVTISGSTVHIVGPGTATITASQTGDVNNAAAPDVPQAQLVISSALANQTITFNALSDNTYGDADYNLTATASSGLPVSYISSDPTIATISGSTVHIIKAGTVTITAQQAGNTSFNAAVNVDQPLTIDQKTLTVTGASASNKTYDGGVAATITGSLLIGIVGSDDVTVIQSGTFTDPNVATAIQVTSTLTLSGSTAANYILTQPTGLVADITPLTITANIVINNKIYDGGVTAVIAGTPILTGVLAADQSNVSVGGTVLANFADPVVGTSKPVTLSSLYNLSGLASGNYLLSQPTGLTAAIMPLTLTVTGLTASDKIYDATTSVTVTGTPTLNGVIAGDDVNLDGTGSENFVDANAGLTKTVAVTGFTISGAASTNYTLAQPTLTAAITKVPLTITGITANSKSYNGTTITTLNGTPALNGILSADLSNVSVSGTPVANFADANLGTGKPVSVTGYTVSGLAAGNYSVVQPTGLTADITQGSQTITFGSLAAKALGSGLFSLTATASSSLAISYTSSNPLVASVSGSTVTIVGTGTTIITASQAGNSNYTAAVPVTQNFTVLPGGTPPTLVAWDLSTLPGGSNNFGPSPFAATSIAATVSTSGLIRGSGITASGTGAASAWGGTGFNATSTTEASGIAASDYVTFSITAGTGFSLYLSGIEAYNIRRSGTGPTTGIWQYQIGAGSFVDIGSAITWGGTTTAAGNSEAAIDLSGIAALQNVAAGTVITFRIINWGATGTAGTWYINDPSKTTASDFGLIGNTVCVPAGTPTTATPASVCQGNSVTLAGSGGGASTYTFWTAPYGGSAITSVTTPAGTVTGNSLITPTSLSAGTYTYYVEGESSAGCPSISRESVVATIKANPIANAGSAQSICSAGSTTLAGNTLVSETGVWSVLSGPGTSNTQFDDATNAAATFTPANGDGIYTLRWTVDSALCTSTSDVVITASNKWQGVTADWNLSSNWSCGVPTAASNVSIPAGTVYPIISGTSFVNNITINNGASLTVSNGGTFHIHGTITNNGGTFDATAGTIEMSGSSAQSIGGSMFASSTINNLIDSNTNTTTGLSINNNDVVDITGQLGFDYPTSILTTNNAVTLVSNASGTASVGEIAEDINGNAQSKINGNVIVQRYFIEHRRWRLITAPVQAPGPTISSSWQEGGQSIAGSISNPNPGFGAHITGPTIGAFVQSTGYDQSPSNSASIAWLTGAASWYALPTTFVPVTSYQGFMLFVRGGRDYPIFTSTSLTPATNATLRTTGNLNTGVQNIPVNTGFTVIGNPYASTINFNSVFSKAATQAALGGTPLSNSFYLWDPNIASAANVANGTGGWVTLTTDGAGGYIAAPDPTNGAFPHPFDINGDIQSGAAFIVNGTGSGSVQIDESDKVTGSSNNSTVLYRPSSSPVTMLRTTLYATSADSTRQPMYLADGVVNIFGENYSNNVNLTEDVQKQQNLNEKCAISKSNTLLSTERRSPAAGGDSILFNLSGLKKSNYRFDFIASNFNRPDLSAVLIDSATHTVTPVHLGDSTTTLNFSVTADSATFANNRFYILFKSVPKSSVPPVIVDTNKVSSGNGIVIYPNPVVNGTMHLQLNNLPAGNYGLNVLSTAGKIVFSKTISYDGENDVQNINIDKAIANGIYILQVLHPDGSITKINFEKQ
jgi:hypothetical protein